MNTYGFLTSEDVRESYVRPIGKDWSPVKYAAVEGRAIFEGCIILGTVSEMERTAETFRKNPALLQDWDESLGIAIRGEQYRWPNRTIPYEIDPQLPARERVETAIAHWHAHTAIRLVPRDAAVHLDYVVFTPGGGCASSVGRQGGRQDIVLGSACTQGNAIHEIGHTVGLWHEQSRADRDQYVEVILSNVAEAYRHNFDQHIEDGEDIATYDYGSIMHYPADAFSISGAPTIRTKKPDVQIGQRLGLSALDIATVAKMYP